jgi:DNA-binding transcriptional ArsR family regulator
MNITDPGVLRALSHPLRQRILNELDVVEHARAADLAEALDEPANSISFHLRVLAKAGIIEEAPEHARDRRDRVWRQTAESFTIDSETPGVDQFLKPYLDWLQTMLVHASRSQGREAAASIRSGLLTEKEMQELADEVNEVISRRLEAGLTAARRDRNRSERRDHRVLFAIGPWETAQTSTPSGDQPTGQTGQEGDR